MKTLGSVRAFKTKLEAMAMKLKKENMMLMDEGEISRKHLLYKKILRKENFGKNKGIIEGNQNRR